MKLRPEFVMLGKCGLRNTSKRETRSATWSGGSSWRTRHEAKEGHSHAEIDSVVGAHGRRVCDGSVYPGERGVPWDERSEVHSGQHRRDQPRCVARVCELFQSR